MPRSRYIRPKALNDRALSTLSLGARLLYFIIPTHMDKQGVILGDSGYLKSVLFPCDAKTRRNHVKKWIDSVCQSGALIRFTYRGTDYLTDPLFNDHQRIYPDEPVLYDVPARLLMELRENWALSKLESDGNPIPTPIPILIPTGEKNENVDNFGSAQEKKSADKGGDSALHKLDASQSEDDRMILEKQKELEKRRADAGLNRDGSEKIYGYSLENAFEKAAKEEIHKLETKNAQTIA